MPTCHYCKNKIKGEFVTFQGDGELQRSYHPEHAKHHKMSKDTVALPVDDAAAEALLRATDHPEPSVRRALNAYRLARTRDIAVAWAYRRALAEADLSRACFALADAMTCVDGFAGELDPYQDEAAWLREGAPGSTYEDACRTLRADRDAINRAAVGMCPPRYAPTYAAALRTLAAATDMLAEAFATSGGDNMGALARAATEIAAIVPRLGGARFAMKSTP